MMMGMINAMKESVTWKMIHEDGVTEGREEGKIEGKEEGKIEGTVLALQAMILEDGEIRFGVPSDPNRETLQKSVDPERLRRIRRRIATASSWEDLLATE